MVIMGCVYSKGGFENPNPRVFQVWNVDDEGRNVKPGRIEVTESQLILYQKGDITVRWPLKSLRRYGFDAELFSFECGRRCPTGPGVYAFRCRRAEALFNILQEYLQGGNAGNISITSIEDQTTISTPAVTPISASSTSNMATTSGTGGSVPSGGFRQLPAVDSSGYLEPITSSRQHHHQCLFGSCSSRNLGGSASSCCAGTSPRGGSSVCIHSRGSEATVEWSSNGAHSSVSGCCSLATCAKTTAGTGHQYANREVAEQVSPGNLCSVHQYANASVIATDPSRRCCCASRCQSSPRNPYENSQVLNSHLPCTAAGCGVACMNYVDVNTNYAKLDDLLKQEQSAKRQKEQQHCYINVKPEQTSCSSGAGSRCVSGGSTPTDCASRCSGVISPSSASLKGQRLAVYENTGSPKSATSPETPREVPKTQVNYAILDLDNNNTSHMPSTSGTGCSVPSTPARTPEGYVQIDFDRTVALSNSTIPCAANDESIRRTRHNAVIPCASIPS